MTRVEVIIIFFLSGVNFFLSISDCYEVVIFLFSG